MENIRYDKKNPPRSLNDANERIEVVRTQLRSISEQLQEAVAGARRLSGQRLDEFEEWRNRVNQARWHYQIELRFLLDWLAEKEFTEVIEAAGISMRFVMDERNNRFSSASPPPDMESAASRLEEDKAGKRSLEFALVLVENAGMEKKSSGIKCDNAYFSLRTKLITRKADFEIELEYLKNWIKLRRSTLLLGRLGIETEEKLAGALIGIIERMKERGARLDPADYDVYNAIQQKMLF